MAFKKSGDRKTCVSSTSTLRATASILTLPADALEEGLARPNFDSPVRDRDADPVQPGTGHHSKVLLSLQAEQSVSLPGSKENVEATTHDESAVVLLESRREIRAEVGRQGPFVSRRRLRVQEWLVERRSDEGFEREPAADVDAVDAKVGVVPRLVERRDCSSKSSASEPRKSRARRSPSA